MRLVRLGLTIVLATLLSATARAYSVLGHEATVDAVWADSIRPLLRQRFPRATDADLQKARAYAYGGSVIQDLGYYPSGNRFFSDLLHYVRSGDFVEALIDEAHDIDEYAFALGALAHYTGDITGHAQAVNRAVPLMFPKLRDKYGDWVTYVQSPSSHVRTEFSFDVVQVATGKYRSQAYHDFIGFEVPKEVLERAFRRVYGLEMKDIFADEDRTISTYRSAVSELLPEITRVAWRDKRDEIASLQPDVEEQDFVFRLSRSDYVKEWGGTKPRLSVRVLTFFYKLVPKIGPLKPLAFESPTPEGQRLFTESFKSTQARYRTALLAVRAGRLRLTDTNFDTGYPAAYGEYPLADRTYRRLLDRLEQHNYETAAVALRQNIVSFYNARGPEKMRVHDDGKQADKLRRQLASLTVGAP
jgi:hypothetical protein